MSSRERFDELARPHLDSAYNMAYWILRNREDAQDAVQDAYLQAFRAFAGFRGDQMRPWLLVIVRNAAFRISRSRRSGALHAVDGPVAGDVSAEGGDIASDEPTPEALAIAADERTQVRDALGRLPAIYREILVLRDMEELSYSEIADVIGTPIGTVMSRLSRARGELRKLLAGPEVGRAPRAL